MGSKTLFKIFAIYFLLCLLVACGAKETERSFSTPTNVKGNDQSGGKMKETGQGEKITLRAVSALPREDVFTKPFDEYFKYIDEATDGRIEVEWIGGPESIPGPNQYDAVQNGVVDINFAFSSYYDTNAPAIRSIILSQLEPWEERENGFYEYIKGAHNSIGTIYLGRWISKNTPFYLYTNEEIQSPTDLQGKSFRTNNVYDWFLKELGISPITVSVGETYTSIESGLVNGFGWGGLIGPRSYGWTEKVKYVIDHPFYNMNGTILINPATWERIPEDLQNKLIEATIKYEEYMTDYFADATNKERELLKEDNVKFIKFSDEIAKEYVNKAYDVQWKYIEEKIPDQLDTLKKLTEK